MGTQREMSPHVCKKKYVTKLLNLSAQTDTLLKNKFTIVHL